MFCIAYQQIIFLYLRKRYEDQIKTLEKDQENLRENLSKKQAELQQLQKETVKP